MVSSLAQLIKVCLFSHASLYLYSRYHLPLSNKRFSGKTAVWLDSGTVQNRETVLTNIERENIYFPRPILFLHAAAIAFLHEVLHILLLASFNLQQRVIFLARKNFILNQSHPSVLKSLAPPLFTFLQ